MTTYPHHAATVAAMGVPKAPYKGDGPQDDSADPINKNADNKSEYDAQEQLNQGNTPNSTSKQGAKNDGAYDRGV